jgi:hypothetical protein
MNIRGGVIVLLLLAAPASEAARGGRVRFVSAKRTYFDVGHVEGLRVRTSVKVTRRGKVIGTCTVDQLGDHGATCPGAIGRAGDAITFEPATSDQAAAPKPLPAPPSTGEVDRAQRALATTDQALVDFHAGGARALTQSASLFTITASHDAYYNVGGPQYEQERLDLSLNGINTHWAGFRVFAHATAVFATIRPPEQHFRPNEIAQVYVYETALSSREVGRPFTLSVGRVWPYHTPGLTLFDGLQVGWRNKDASVEAGVYGGTIPDPITLYPTYDHYTAGFYYAHVVTRGKKSTLRLLQHEGRLGVRGAPGFGAQLELEESVQAALLGWIDLGAQARGSIGADDWKKPAFESARVHLGLRPVSTLRILATFRYLGPRPADFDAFTTSHFFTPSSAFFTTLHEYHGTLDLGWDPRPWISLMLQGGVDYETDNHDGREYFGPEVGLPRLFGRVGGLSVGYREELGWYAGREAHVQFNVLGIDRLRGMARVSYFEDRIGGGFSSPATRELGLYGMVEARILRWLSLRGSVMARVTVDAYGTGVNAPAPPPFGLNGRLDLIGSL